MEKLKKSRVAVFGISGVGGYVCEALVRSGIGSFDLTDDDRVCLTNLNRQIIATRKTVGKYKSDMMKERMLEINPDVEVTVYKCFFLPENAEKLSFEKYDYVVDAVDTVTAKLEIVTQEKKKQIPVISCMGAGNKLDASAFHVADIYKTKMCPLAKVMRRELKKRGIKELKVVYSEEKPTKPLEDMSVSCRSHCICPPGTKHKCTERRDIPGSVAFVPSSTVSVEDVRRIVNIVLNQHIIKQIVKCMIFCRLTPLTENEILRTIAMFRYVNPEANIRLAAGRTLLENDGEKAFHAGASATITGNMLTTASCATIRSDREMLAGMGRDVEPKYSRQVGRYSPGRRDKIGNVIIYKPASAGYESHPFVTLQAHMDMVWAKRPESDHDFEKDPLKLYVEDGFLRARGTTLGADDGTGVAYMLAVLDDDTLKAPVLEAIFTVQEEVGLHGAYVEDSYMRDVMVGAVRDVQMVGMNFQTRSRACI